MHNPYHAPASDVAQVVDDGLTYTPRVFTVQGRIGRQRYMAYTMGLSLLVMAAGTLMAVVLVLINPLLVVLLLLLLIPALVFGLLLGKRRLNDRDQSGWWVLLMLVPFLNVALYLYLMCAPGTRGANSYGPKPGANTLLVNIGAVVFVLFSIGAVFAPTDGLKPDALNRALEQYEPPASVPAPAQDV